MEQILGTLALLDKDKGQSISVVGDTYRVIITGEQTGNAYAVIDMQVPKGGGPGPHAHPDFQEAFYIMDGEIEVSTEKGNYTAASGSFVNIPKGGIVHQFKNIQDKTAHMFCIVVPAGLELFFEEIGIPVEPGKFLPPPEMTDETKTKLEAIAEKHGQQLFPPDYLS